MRVQLRSGKQTTKTTRMTFEAETVTQISNNIALALLSGGYNPLRKYSTDSKPIDWERLNQLREKFDDLIYEVKEEMLVNINEVEDF